MKEIILPRLQSMEERSETVQEDHTKLETLEPKVDNLQTRVEVLEKRLDPFGGGNTAALPKDYDEDSDPHTTMKMTVWRFRWMMATTRICTVMTLS